MQIQPFPVSFAQHCNFVRLQPIAIITFATAATVKDLASQIPDGLHECAIKGPAASSIASTLVSLHIWEKEQEPKRTPQRICFLEESAAKI